MYTAEFPTVVWLAGINREQSVRVETIWGWEGEGWVRRGHPGTQGSIGQNAAASSQASAILTQTSW